MLETDTPFIRINATDINIGARFGFEQGQFDMMCSDLSTFPIARAVAASSAVPVILSPITLHNYDASTCGYQLSNRYKDILRHGDISSREYQEAQRIEFYGRPEGNRYVHLLDGGLADNLGLRATTEKTTQAGGYVELVQKSGYVKFRRVAHIVVNAQKDVDSKWARSARAPGILSTMISASGVPLNRYNFETVETFKRDRLLWMEELRQFRCSNPDTRSSQGDCDDLTAYFIEINFAQHPDPIERAYLTSLPTSFTLDAEAVDRIRAAARLLLNQSEEFQRFLHDLETLN